jgi:hypothetical protein
MVATAWELTPFVSTVNVPDFWPASTVTVAGTLADGLLLDKATVVPPGPAGPLRVAAPVEELPPVTVAGFKLREANVAGEMVSVADWEAPPRDPAMFAAVWVLTPDVLTVNVALFCPAATVTVLGTVAAELPLDKETAVPPGPAGPLRVAVPVEELPPVTEAGFKLIEAKVAGAIVRLAVLVVPETEAEMAAIV